MRRHPRAVYRHESRETVMLDESSLANSEIVANSSMNRRRGLAGPNSYARDLHFDVPGFLRERLRERSRVAWLDLCCGSGRALIEAGRALPADRVEIMGVDLVPAFDPLPADVATVRFEAASLAAWNADRAYDLITCVHGLHYVGDKLGLVARALSWLKDDGHFLAHLDACNLRFHDPENAAGAPAGPAALKRLRGWGMSFDPRRRILRCVGSRRPTQPYEYVGADDAAGPNYTGQPAVASFYQ
ncbi:MAG: class I SAM-dependent methyltransferase [Actinomycetota bacterium]